MKELYEKLYDVFNNLESFKNNAHFVSMQGPFYQQNSRRFLLIGRATNGWMSLPTASRDFFGNEAQKQFDDRTRWNWVEAHDDTLYSAHDKGKKNYSQRYCLSKKPFWYYTKAIWYQLPGDIQSCDIWMKNIAWSNLYKVSPITGHNPNEKSKSIQLDVCKSILKKELEQYQPTHILISTGYDWFAPFADIFENVKKNENLNSKHGKDKNNIYVEGTASYGDAKTVISCRPEWKNKQVFVSSIVSAFQQE